MNLDDIAKLAGVSRTTVSRVINEHPDVSAKTRQKVRKIIEEHNFHPNLAARMLVNQRTHIIGVAFSDPHTTFRSHYPSILFQGITSVTNLHDYATLVWWHQDPTNENPFVQRILPQNRLMDGMLVTSVETDGPLIDYLLKFKIPFVMLEKPMHHADEIYYVTIDNYQSAKEAVIHLIKTGHRKIAHIYGMSANMDAKERFLGYQHALEENGIQYDPTLVAQGAFSRQAGYAAMQELLARDVSFDAVFAGNDDTADGVLLALHQAKLRVPEDVALVGFDDTPLAEELDPKLTTIHQPIQERGAQAALLLLDILNGKVTEACHKILPTHLVVRKSCGA